MSTVNTNKTPNSRYIHKKSYQNSFEPFKKEILKMAIKVNSLALKFLQRRNPITSHFLTENFHIYFILTINIIFHVKWSRPDFNLALRTCRFKLGWTRPTTRFSTHTYVCDSNQDWIQKNFGFFQRYDF